jgi:hypothetical protein
MLSHIISSWALCLSLSTLALADRAIYIDNNALMRLNRLRAGQSYQDARVTQLQWTTTVDDVTRTCTDFNNDNGLNVPLWLPVNTFGFLYTGHFVSQLYRGIVPQYGLSGTDTSGKW